MNPDEDYSADDDVAACEPSGKKRKYAQKKRERVSGRNNKKNPWKGACTCLPQAVLDAPGGRTHHKPYFPIERWLVDASIGDPVDGEECVALADAGTRRGQIMIYNARQPGSGTHWEHCSRHSMSCYETGQMERCAWKCAQMSNLNWNHRGVRKNDCDM